MSASSPNNESLPTASFASLSEELDVLDAVISQTRGKSNQAGSAGAQDGASSTPGIQNFLDGRLDAEAVLVLWTGDFRSQIENLGFTEWKTRCLDILSAACQRIDDLAGGYVDSIIHHEKFQKLEASWRGIQLLLSAAASDPSRNSKVKVRLLNVSWREIKRDFDRASEFDQSELFKKIYEDEFGAPGGEPFGAMVVDAQIHPRPSPSHQFDDVKILDQLAGVAAAAFCPTILGASPSLFGVDEFHELQGTKDLARGFDVKELIQWRSFRKQEDARFIGIALPQILLRAPYKHQDTREFFYEEDVSSDPREATHLRKHLWGNAAYAWATVLIRCFQDSGWFADIRGTVRNRPRGGGLVTDLPTISFGTDRDGVAIKASTDHIVTDEQEAELAKLGFLPLCRCKDTSHSAFYSSQSVQEPQKYYNAVASANARISTMMQYMLCVSRFAHYLKVIARNLTGSAVEADEMQSQLESWIQEYVTPDKRAKTETKAKRPLRDAKISVSPEAGKPGSYKCTFSLLPHYQLDDLSAAVMYTTKLSSADEPTN